jgi:alpha-tubulin suppressor-like RCC1 family protein
MMLWGKNSYGQLGFGDSKSTNYPKINQELRSKGKVRAAALGANHTLVVMVMNKVYAFGDNQFGQLGFEGGGRLWKIAKEIADLDKMNICQVAAGDQHSVALSVFGEVWSWGGSPYGQLGHGGITDISRPTPLLERHNIPPDVKSIACGNTFTAALSKNGSLYTWGQGESGELGHPEKVLLYAPTPVQEFHNVSQVACGHRHMAAVIFKPRRSLGGMDGGGLVGDNATTKGSQSGDGESVGRSSKHRSTVMMTPHKRHGVALTWGEDTCGQLGMRGLQSARSPTIMQLLLGHNIVHAAANSDCSAFVTDTGSVFMCGKGDEGRLGLGHLGPAPTPTEVRNLGILNRIVMVACGFGHTLALSDDRRVFAWGEGTWGNTGVTNSSECLEPIEIHSLTTKEVRSVHAGGFHSSAITADGNLYCWGKNTNGQLGIGTVTSAEESPQRVSSIIGIVKDVAMGRNHTAIIMMVLFFFSCREPKILHLTPATQKN